MTAPSSRWLRFAVLLVAFAAPAFAQVPDKGEVDKLINDLGSDDGKTRAAAGEKLVAIGEEALAALRIAVAKHADPDVRLRAAVVASSIEKKGLGEIRKLEGHKDIVWAVAFSPDGKHAVSAGGDRLKNGAWEAGEDFDVRLWDVETGKEVRRFKGHTSGVTSAVFSKDGKQLLTGSGDSTVRLWEVESGKEVRALKGHTDRVMGVALSPDGKIAYSGGNDGIVRAWKTESGEALFQYRTGVKSWALAVSADGKRLATSFTTSLRILDAETGRLMFSRAGHTMEIKAIAFTPDSKHVVTGSFDKTLRLWEVATGREVRRFTGHTDRVECVAVSEDGNYVLSGGLDKTVRVWSLATGNEDRVLEGHTEPLGGVAFSPDGRLALSGSWDKTVRVWRLSKK